MRIPCRAEAPDDQDTEYSIILRYPDSTKAHKIASGVYHVNSKFQGENKKREREKVAGGEGTQYRLKDFSVERRV